MIGRGRLRKTGSRAGLEAPSRSQRAGTWLLGFFLFSGIAETLQGVAILWASYAITGNAAITGAVNAAAYLPGVVLGLVLRNRADAGNAARLLSFTNWVLLLGSTALAVVWSQHPAHSVILAAFLAVQCSLSVVKALNKAYVSRFVRAQFVRAQAKVLLNRATSLALVGGLVGGGSAGLILDDGATDWCFGLAAGLYALSVWSVRRVRKACPEAEDEAAPAAQATAEPKPAAQAVPPTASPGRNGVLRLILLYSVPSSGALPFLSTLMVPLAQAVVPGSGGFYAILTVTAMFGGFLAGMALSSERLSVDRALSTALTAGAVLITALAVTRWEPGVVVLMLITTAVLTSHVMVMQVLTNQAPPADQVGRFSVVRNAVAGSAKGGFSLLAGWLMDTVGLTAAWLVLAAVLGVFGIAWLAVRRSPHTKELAGVV